MFNEGRGRRRSLNECGRFGEPLREAVEAAGAGGEDDEIVGWMKGLGWTSGRIKIKNS